MRAEPPEADVLVRAAAKLRGAGLSEADINDLAVWRGVLLVVREIVRTERDVGEQVN